MEDTKEKVEALSFVLKELLQQVDMFTQTLTKEDFDLLEKAKKLFEAIICIADERDILLKQNQKYKEVIDKINDHIRTCCNMDSKFTNLHYDYAQNEMSADQVDELLDILKEVK